MVQCSASVGAGYSYILVGYNGISVLLVGSGAVSRSAFGIVEWMHVWSALLGVEMRFACLSN